MDYKELKRLIGMLKLGDDLTSYAESKLMSFIKEQEAEQLILSGVVKSLPIKNTMDYGQWIHFNKIKEDGCGGYKWDGVHFSAFSIKKMYDAYKM